MTLLSLPRVGNRTVAKLLSKHRITKIIECTEKYELIRLLDPALRKFTKNEFTSAREKAFTILNNCKGQNIKIISILDDIYPKRLKKIVDYPVLLFYKGDISIVNNSKVAAVIGTREPSEYGGRIAYRIGERLAEDSVTVVSGLALGCDSEAHKGCISKFGKTVAVLGNSIDRIYPAKNKNLAENIVLTGGCIISEYGPGQKTGRSSLVLRDRIQSGLSDVIIVIETGLVGGTMHTVRFAEEQNRKVYAFQHPSNYLNDKSRGNLELFKSKRAVPLANIHELKNLRYSSKSLGPVQYSIFDVEG